jgi:protein-disulfide isomerase
MRVLFAAALSVLLTALPANAQSSADEAFTEEQRAALPGLIREYLLENPEVIEEAIIELQVRRDIEREEAARAAIASLEDLLHNDPRDFSVGPEDAPVQIVEFFDYNCPYCRASAPWLRETLEEHGDKIRVVFKEAPIFAESRESSSLSAQLAVAARDTGHYLDLHFALMEPSGTLPVSQVRHIAEEVGLDWDALEPVMESPETAQQLEDGLDLLDAIGATGTPAFIVNGELVQGADFDRLEALVAEALGEES